MSSKAYLPSYVKAFLKDYDEITLESLVRNLGQGKAMELLVEAYCSTQAPIDPKVIKMCTFIGSNHFRVYINIMALRTRAMIKHKDDKGVIQFAEEMTKHIKIYHASPAEMLKWKKSESKGSDPVVIKQCIDRHVFKVCYFMAWINRMPERNQIIKTVNKYLSDGLKVETYLSEECLYGTPVEARKYFELNMTLEQAIKRFIPGEVMDLIDKNAEMEVLKLRNSM